MLYLRPQAASCQRRHTRLYHCKSRLGSWGLDVSGSSRQKGIQRLEQLNGTPGTALCRGPRFCGAGTGLTEANRRVHSRRGMGKTVACADSLLPSLLLECFFFFLIFFAQTTSPLSRSQRMALWLGLRCCPASLFIQSLSQSIKPLVVPLALLSSLESLLHQDSSFCYSP